MTKRTNGKNTISVICSRVSSRMTWWHRQDQNEWRHKFQMYWPNWKSSRNLIDHIDEGLSLCLNFLVTGFPTCLSFLGALKTLRFLELYWQVSRNGGVNVMLGRGVTPSFIKTSSRTILRGDSRRDASVLSNLKEVHWSHGEGLTLIHPR